MNIFFIILGVILFIYIVNVVIRGTFDINESIFWLIGTIIILVLSIFPKIIDKLSNAIGIDYPPSLLFLLVAIFLLFINFRNTQRIAKQKEKITELAQNIAIIKEELITIKKENNNE